jgi:SulP family sulfate permease
VAPNGPTQQAIQAAGVVAGAEGTLAKALNRAFPFLRWIRESSAASLRGDLVAGLTVALVLVPQSMAYAQLAGLPPHYGLYAAFLPPLFASLFGSSRQLATGPVAVVSLMTAATLKPIATAGSSEYITYAILLALMVGVFQLALGVLRLGLVVNLLSHPVVNGFTCAAALIIATSQLPKIFGVYADEAEHHYQTVLRVIHAALNYTHWPTVGVAVLAFGTMIGLRKINPKIPNVLVAVVLTTIVSALIGFQNDTDVKLSQIQSPEVANNINRFNAVVHEREKLEALRANTNKTMSETVGWIKQESPGLCMRCHARREPDLFAGAMSGAPLGRSEKGAALHQMAGLIDAYLDELRREESGIRTQLRAYRFERVIAADGEAQFFLRSQKPKGLSGERGAWRIRVSGQALDKDKITLRGGGAVVGSVPAGLPAFRLPPVRSHLAVLLKLMPAAIIISMLGFMEAISIAKAMAARTRQKVDPNQELIGQGVANIVGCCGQSYACSGSFSRSAVNLQAGARTGLSNVFSSGVVVVVLLFCTPLLYYLPQATLAAIIMMAVVGLLNVSGFVHAWRVQKFDGITGIVSFVGTLAFAPHLEWGITAGVALSLGGYLVRAMRPKVAKLSPHPDGSLRDARRHRLTQCRHLAVIRFDGPLNFASVSYLEDEVLAHVAEMPELKHVLIDAQGISEMDASGEDMLRQLIRQLRSLGYYVSFAGLKYDVLDALKRAGLYDIIGEQHLFPTQARAMAAVYALAHAGSKEVDCPFRTVMPRVTELSLAQDGSLRDAQRRDLPVCERIAIFRFDDTLNFANTSFLEEEMLRLVAARPLVRHVMFAAQGITAIDASGAEKLGQFVERLRSEGYDIAFSSFKDDAMDVLQRMGVVQKIGEDHIYPTQALAIAGIYAQAHAGASEPDCPLQPLLPHVVELSLHPDGSLRDAERHELKLCRHIAAIRFDGPLSFATVGYLETELLERLKARPEVNHVLIAAHAVNGADTRAAEQLARLVEQLRQRKYDVAFSGLKDNVLDVFNRAGVVKAIGPEHMYPTQAVAVAGLYARAHAGSAEPDCPLQPLLPRVVELSLHPDGSLRDAARHGLRLCRHVFAVRPDGPLNAATVGYLESELLARLKTRAEVHHVLIAAHGVNEMDPRAAEELSRLVTDLRDKNYEVAFSGLKDNILDLLEQVGSLQKIGQDCIYATQALAVAGIYAPAHAGSTELDCPLLPLLPRVTELSLHPDGSLRDAGRHGLRLCRRIAAIRFDGPLNLATVGYLESELLARLRARAEVTHVLIAAHSINEVDRPAAEQLRTLVGRLRRKGYQVSFSGLKDNALDLLERIGVVKEIGEENMYPTQALAIAGLFATAHGGSAEPDCPLRPLLPRVVELSLHPDGSLRDARRHGLKLCRHIAAIRFDGPLNFATIGFLKSELLERLQPRAAVRHVLIAAHAINEIDTRAAGELRLLVQQMRQRGYDVSFSGLKDNVLDVLARVGVIRDIGEDHMYSTQALAVSGLNAAAHRDSTEGECPLRKVIYQES